MTRPLAGALCFVLASALAAATAAAATSAQPAASVAGESIYIKGTLRSGQPLEAARAEASPLEGEAAACVNCHRRSGLGSKEARNIVPPVTGNFLFHTKGAPGPFVDLPYVPSARPDREAYTEETLARAIRDGIDSQGRTLDYLMPRFALGDADMRDLVAYLQTLDRPETGVTPTEIHFATIITPDADPVKRAGMLDVLNRFFTDRNAAQPGPITHMMTSGKTAYSKTMFKVNRHWVLHVWEPKGPPGTWTEQLRKLFRARPVFAVVSGLGGSDWTPVHAFCENEQVPCLFPNVELPPPAADRDFHSLYFSRGVLLEADLLAGAIGPGSEPTRVRQVYRSGDVGAAAAAALAASLHGKGIKSEQRVLPAGAGSAEINKAVESTDSKEAIVLWLRPRDLASLGAPPAGPVYVSGLMGGLEQAPLPAAWRGRSHLAYPVDLPEERRVRIDYALGWFNIRKIPVVAQQVQADTYLVCGLASETIKHMIDALFPDYMIERLEDTLEHRVLTGYYPRLALGSHQRFASKGGYVVRFDPQNPRRVRAEGEWTSP